MSSKGAWHTTVVNRHHGVPYDAYIGHGTPWGNPYRIGPDGSRDEVVDKYRSWFRDRVKDPAFRAETIALRGKRLCCSCAPARCHGDIIAEWLHHPASLLTLLEDTASSYAPRTKANARAADLTVAFALDFTTGGEVLTHKVAGQRYVAIHLGAPIDASAATLAAALRAHGAQSLNVAGNGIYRLAQHGWDQSTVDQWVHAVLDATIAMQPFQSVRSGGQTGADLAGGIAALALGLPTTLLFPKGFLQRDADGRDATHRFGEIWKQIEEGLAALKHTTITRHGTKTSTPAQQALFPTE